MAQTNEEVALLTFATPRRREVLRRRRAAGKLKEAFEMVTVIC